MACLRIKRDDETAESIGRKLTKVSSSRRTFSPGCFRGPDTHSKRALPESALTEQTGFQRDGGYGALNPKAGLPLPLPFSWLPSMFGAKFCTHLLSDYTWGLRRAPDSGKESACGAGVLGLIPRSGRSVGEGNSDLLQYSCLENPMDRGAWWTTVHGVTKSQTLLSDEHFHFLSNAGGGVPQDTVLTAKDPEKRAASNTRAHLSPRLHFSLVWCLRCSAFLKAKEHVQVRHGWRLAHVSWADAALEHLFMWSGRTVDRVQGKECSLYLSHAWFARWIFFILTVSHRNQFYLLILGFPPSCIY